MDCVILLVLKGRKTAQTTPSALTRPDPGCRHAQPGLSCHNMEIDMQINITGHHIEVTPALRAYVTEKLQRISRHFDHVISINVILKVENPSSNRPKARCTRPENPCSPRTLTPTCMQPSTASPTSWTNRSAAQGPRARPPRQRCEEGGVAGLAATHRQGSIQKHVNQRPAKPGENSLRRSQQQQKASARTDQRRAGPQQ